MLTDSYFENLSVFRKHFEDKNKHVLNKPKRGYALSALALMLVAIITSVAIFVPYKINDDETVKKYLASNRGEVVSTIEEINANTNAISLENVNVYQSVIMYYDKLYNEALYYVVHYGDNSIFTEATITIVTNNDFQFEWKVDGLTSTYYIHNFALKYKEEIIMSDVIGTVQAFGKMDCGTEQIYIEYSGISLDGTSNFVELVESMIVPK